MTGYQGAQGYQGYQGQQGYRGFRGHKGQQGFQGHQGLTGYQGMTGNLGAYGANQMRFEYNTEMIAGTNTHPAGGIDIRVFNGNKLTIHVSNTNLDGVNLDAWFTGLEKHTNKTDLSGTAIVTVTNLDDPK